jgi:HJR/Mrr/RecB family endonuclease
LLAGGFLAWFFKVPVWVIVTVGVLLAASLITWYVWRSRANRARMLRLNDLHALSHRDLEFHVAAVIDALPGWRAEATQGSNDQGADVIASGPRGVRVVVQVKHYSSGVGNKAVQEIVASKAFYKASEAVVFTSGPGYTRQAQELARANGVRLWGADELFQLQKLAQRRQKPNPALLPV